MICVNQGYVVINRATKCCQKVYFNVNYCITKTNEKYPILNDRFSLKKFYDRENESTEKIYFATFGQPCIDTVKPFGELKPKHHTIYYKTQTEVENALSGIKLVPDIQYATKRKKELLKELAELEKYYKI